MKQMMMNTGTQSITLDSVVKDLMRSMLADYPADYRWAYPTSDKAVVLKTRLISKLRNVRLEAIIVGYESAVDESPSKMPPVPMIAVHVKKTSARMDRIANELKQIESTPVITNTPRLCDPAKLYAEAKARPNTGDIQAKINELQALIIKGKVTGRIKGSGAKIGSCCIPGCNNPGTFANVRMGAEFYYCDRHIHRE